MWNEKKVWGWTDTPTDILPRKRKCKLRSKFWWLTKVCNSHDVSHFAAFFIVVGAKTSVAESVFSFMDWYVGLCFAQTFVSCMNELFSSQFRCFEVLRLQIKGIKCGEWGQQVTHKLLFGGYTERKKEGRFVLTRLLVPFLGFWKMW